MNGQGQDAAAVVPLRRSIQPYSDAISATNAAIPIGAASAKSPGATAWINDCGPLVSKPKSIVLACADAGYGLAALPTG